MLETLQALLGLQEIDRDIFKVESELKRLPKELAVRQGALDQKLAGVEERRRAVHDLNAQIKEIEDATTLQRQRLRKLEGEALKNKTDAALLASYDHEIRSVKRTISQAEDDGLQLVDQAKGFETEADALEASLAEERAVFEEFENNVAKEIADAEARLAVLRKERESKTSTAVEPAALDLYLRLLERRHGEAMAELAGAVCQGCFVGIPKNLTVRLARGTELIQCPSCDRILYVHY